MSTCTTWLLTRARWNPIAYYQKGNLAPSVSSWCFVLPLASVFWLRDLFWKKQWRKKSDCLYRMCGYLGMLCCLLHSSTPSNCLRSDHDSSSKFFARAKNEPKNEFSFRSINSCYWKYIFDRFLKASGSIIWADATSLFYVSRQILTEIRIRFSRDSTITSTNYWLDA